MRGFASYIMRGPMTAATVVVGFGVLALIIWPFGLVSAAALALVTLRVGPRYGLAIWLGGSLFMGLMAQLTLGSPALALVFAGLMWPPVWLLAWILRATRALPLAVLAAGGLGVLLVAAVHLALPDPDAWWQARLEAAFEPAMGEMGLDADQRARLEEALAALARRMTGLMAAGFVLNGLMALLVGRYWQALLYNPGGFRQEFHALRLGRWPALATVVLAVLALVPAGALSQAAGDAALVMLGLYVLQGLAIAHALVALKGLHVAWLVALYVLLVFAMPQVMAVLALLGFADTWWDVRRRLARRASKTE